MFIDQTASRRGRSSRGAQHVSRSLFRSYGAWNGLLSPVAINILLLRSLRSAPQPGSKTPSYCQALAAFFFCFGLLRGGFEVGR